MWHTIESLRPDFSHSTLSAWSRGVWDQGQGLVRAWIEAGTRLCVGDPTFGLNHRYCNTRRKNHGIRTHPEVGCRLGISENETSARTSTPRVIGRQTLVVTNRIQGSTIRAVMTIPAGFVVRCTPAEQTLTLQVLVLCQDGVPARRPAATSICRKGTL